MFTKYIGHLKNLLFLQFVVYFLCISAIIVWIQALVEEHEIAVMNQENIQQVLTEETLKLYSIIDSKKEILESYINLNERGTNNCLNYQNIMLKIQNLAVKYKLLEPIEVTIDKGFFKDYFQELGDKKVRVENYNVSIRYFAPDLLTLLKIFQEIYSHMPPNTIVTSAHIGNEKIITPKNIYKLRVNQSPHLIYIELIMCIRELATG